MSNPGQEILAFWQPGIDHGQIALPAGEGTSSFIDVRDTADSAAAALTFDHVDHLAAKLTAPEAPAYAEAAILMSCVTDKPIT